MASTNIHEASTSDDLEATHSKHLCDTVRLALNHQIERSQRDKNGRRRVILNIGVLQAGEVYDVLPHGKYRHPSETLYLERLLTAEELDRIEAEAKSAGWRIEPGRPDKIVIVHFGDKPSRKGAANAVAELQVDRVGS